MYHSVTFSLPDSSSSSGYKWRKNSYSDFHLVSDGRPVIPLPEPITKYIDVPGASGQLDISESLTNYPLYTSREGSINFIVLNDYGPEDNWSKRYQMISQHIHGRRLEMVLEDDPEYFYEGRFKIESWESPSDGPWSTLTIGFLLDSYKYWDELIDLPIPVDSTGTTLYFSHRIGNLGTMPAIPLIEVTQVSSQIEVTATNPEIFSGTVVHNINHAAMYQFQDIVLSDFDGENTCSLRFKGNGYVRVYLRNGDL